MSGLDKNMLLVIECLAKNRIQDAKKAAIACCANDTTKKNQRQINYCKNLLNIGSLELTTLPANLQGLIHIQDVSDFPENRYYVGTVQRQLYDKIYAGTQVACGILVSRCGRGLPEKKSKKTVFQDEQ